MHPGREPSPARNRVTPFGELVAIPQRGAWCGNRGILHRGTEVVRFHASDLWLTCALQYREQRLPQWQPHHFTLLFFLDEATSLAAGHRPCAWCRRTDYEGFRDAVTAGTGIERPLARELDARLHGERIVRGSHRRRLHETAWADVPDGAFVVRDGAPLLVAAGRLSEWTPAGYRPAGRRPTRGEADLLTPPSIAAALRAGYEPQLDESANG